MKQENPDLLMLGTIVRETAGVAAELKKIGWQVDVMTTAAACNAGVPALGKETVEGFFVQCQYVPFDAENEPAAVQDWLKRYQAKFNAPATEAAAISYNMQELTILALERAGKNLTVDSFVAATESIKAWQDIFGTPPITFTKDQHIGVRAFVMTRIQNGKFKRIAGPLTDD